MKRFMAIAFFCAGLLSNALPVLAGEQSISLQQAAGSETTAAHCAICHSLDYIGMNAPVMDRGAWQKTVRKMIDRFGAPVTDDDAREIVDYLTTHYSHVP